MTTLAWLLILAGVIYLIYRRAERSIPRHYRRDGITTTLHKNK